MRIIARGTLREFWEKPGHTDSEGPLKAWFHEVQKAAWRNNSEIKKKYRSASIISSERVVFNIAGNKYRLIVAIKYKIQIVYVRFVGTHKEYDKIDPETV